jgi:predicted enzyme related to lactoylglutathione lyase
MLKDHPVHATIPCKDYARAKAFYAEKLGLEPSDEQPDAAFFSFPDGSRFLLFASGGTASGAHTQMGWNVSDIDAEVSSLKQRGSTSRHTTCPASTRRRASPIPGPSVRHGSRTARATCSASSSWRPDGLGSVSGS